jgi:hypothetical protein
MIILTTLSAGKNFLANFNRFIQNGLSLKHAAENVAFVAGLEYTHPR